MTTIQHQEHLHDRAAMLVMRGLLAIQPAMTGGSADRPAFDELMMKTPEAEGVIYAAASVGGVPGWWCRPADAVSEAAILYLHGGAYVMGSAAAYRHFVGQIAWRAGLAAFVPDYALAPERPFPAAFDDALAAYRGFVEEGRVRIVLAGDSAGGGLMLALLAAVCCEAAAGPRPFAAVALSPWIDLALCGDSIETRAKADPLLNREVLANAASLYLGAHDPEDVRVCALFARASDLPPVQLHVGEDEILLDDAVRYAEKVERSGGQAELHTWAGMAHVFPSNLSGLRAAAEALDLIGRFIRNQRDALTSDTDGATSPH